MIVKPGMDIMDDSTPEGQILLKIWKGVTSQPTGPYRVFWGTEVENPSNFWGFFDFPSVEGHEKFAQEYAPSNPWEHTIPCSALTTFHQVWEGHRHGFSQDPRQARILKAREPHAVPTRSPEGPCH